MKTLEEKIAEIIKVATAIPTGFRTTPFSPQAAEVGLMMLKERQQFAQEALDIIEESQAKSDCSKVTRFEVIDESGRIVVKYGVKVDLSFQDNGRTLKVFIKNKE